jgi:hypothetical protein
MALKKSVTLGSGVQANYHKITRLNIDVVNKHADVTLALYVSEELKTEGKEPISNQGFFWSGDDYPFTIDALNSSNPIAIAYAKIKATVPFFTDAEDC